MKLEKKTQFNLWYFLIAFWLIVAIQQYWTAQQQTESISYSQFEQELAAGKISKVFIHEQLISGEYAQPQNGKSQFVTPRVEPQLAEALSKYKVEYSGVVHSDFMANLMSWVAPAVIFFLIWYYGFRKLAERGGGFMTVGQSKAKVYVDKDTGVTFDQVAGVDEAKAELQEIIEFLKNPKEYGRLGAHTRQREPGNYSLNQLRITSLRSTLLADSRQPRASAATGRRISLAAGKMVVDGVSSEPVSGTIPCFTGN